MIRVVVVITILVMLVYVAGVFDGCMTAGSEATALEMYSSDAKGAYPPTLALLTPNYLKVIPTCPTAEVDTYGRLSVPLMERV